MSDENKLVRIDPGCLVAPGEPDSSLDAMGEHRGLSRIKVVQGMSDPAIKDAYGEGAMLANPGQVLLARRGESLPFVPVFFFSEFATWSDIRDANSPTILARSFDARSDIARKSMDPKAREEEYPGGPRDKPFKMRHVAGLNFVGVVDDPHDLSGTPLVATFLRGEYFRGRAFVNAILLRRHEGRRVKLWAQRWVLSTSLRELRGNRWWGIDFAGPADGALVLDGEKAATARASHEFFLGLHEQQKLVVAEVGREDEPEPEAPF